MNTDKALAMNLRKWAATIKVDTVEKAEMALDLVLAAQRLEHLHDELSCAEGVGKIGS